MENSRKIVTFIVPFSSPGTPYFFNKKPLGTERFSKLNNFCFRVRKPDLPLGGLELLRKSRKAFS